MILPLLIYIQFVNATEWIQDMETSKLYLCDKVVGIYYDNNKEQIYSWFQTYEVSEQKELVLNHFFYMINNCIQGLRIKYPNSSVDDSLVNQIDWQEIVHPQQFMIENRDLSKLTLEEIEIRSRMRSERQLIEQELERNQSYFGTLLKHYNITIKELSIYAIIIIMSIFFYNLFKAFKFMINEHIKYEEIMNRNKKKKN